VAWVVRSQTDCVIGQEVDWYVNVECNSCSSSSRNKLTSSCTFYNTISFSLSSPVPGLHVLILILPSLCIPVLIVQSPHPSHIHVRIVKSYVPHYALSIHCIASLTKSTPASESPCTPCGEFPAFCPDSSPMHYNNRNMQCKQSQIKEIMARAGRFLMIQVCYYSGDRAWVVMS
jgi:hypothetical protein